MNSKEFIKIMYPKLVKFYAQGGDSCERFIEVVKRTALDEKTKNILLSLTECVFESCKNCIAIADEG